jgi:ribosome-binding ATPase
MLADLESLEKRSSANEKKAKGGDKDAKALLTVIEKVLPALREGKPARTTLAAMTEDEIPVFKGLQLLTSKPVVYVCNVEEASAAHGNAFSQRVAEFAKAEGAVSVVISAKIEAEFAGLPEADRMEYLKDMGLEEPGLNRLIRAGYSLLDLVTYFTIGPKEARAWTIIRGTKAPQAAAVIHSDFEKGFIRSETIACADYIQFNGESGCKDAGKFRLEGKEYIVKDGDVLHFRFNT